MRVWLAPNAAVPDLQSLFRVTDSWREAMARVNVLMLNQWVLAHEANPQAGPNGVAALKGVGAFDLLADWGIALALEAGAVSDFSAAHPGATAAALLDTLGAIREAGGEVGLVAMDEPFTYGLASPPHGLGWDPQRVAAAVAEFQATVRAAYTPAFGLEEAYPDHTGTAIAAYCDELVRAGVQPAFLHVDVDYYRVKRERADLPAALRAMQDWATRAGVPFGVVVWGEHGTSDEAFCKDALALAQAIHDAIGFPSQQDAIFQSWSPDAAGGKTHPHLLPEGALYTHTWLVNDVMRRLAPGAPAPSEDH